jgi:hypothetical protein
MSVVNGLLTVVFALFTYFQLNDPDPQLWVTWYSFLTFLTGFAVFKKFWMPSILVGIGVCLVWMGLLLPAFLEWIKEGMPSITSSMKAETPFVEFIREFLGLLVCLMVLVGLFFQAKKVKAVQN